MRDKLQMGVLHCAMLKTVAAIISELSRNRCYFQQRLPATYVATIFTIATYITLCHVGSCNVFRNAVTKERYSVWRIIFSAIYGGCGVFNDKFDGYHVTICQHKWVEL